LRQGLPPTVDVQDDGQIALVQTAMSRRSSISHGVLRHSPARLLLQRGVDSRQLKFGRPGRSRSIGRSRHWTSSSGKKQANSRQPAGLGFAELVELEHAIAGATSPRHVEQAWPGDLADWRRLIAFNLS
jgi:hypothetical protein